MMVKRVWGLGCRVGWRVEGRTRRALQASSGRLPPLSSSFELQPAIRAWGFGFGFVVCGLWCVVCGLWFVVCGLWV